MTCYFNEEMKQTVRDLVKQKKTKGYRVIVDGKHYTFSRYCKALENEFNSIIGEPKMFRNMLGELAIDYDWNDGDRF